MSFFYDLIGNFQEELEWWQMAIRAVIVFFYSILVLRLSNKRIFGKNTAFDIVLGIILGSILSRAITGNSDFFPTLLAGLILVLLHRIIGYIAASSKWGSMIKGNKRLIIDSGKLHYKNMRFSSLSKEDIAEQLRLREGINDIDRIERAYLERNGDLSFTLKDA